MATVISQILDFFFKMSSDAPAFKVTVLASDFELWIEVMNIIGGHSNSNIAQHNGIYWIYFKV